MATLLSVGETVAALLSSPLGTIMGAGIALVTAMQAIRDIASGKVQLKRADTTEFPNINGHRNTVRKKIAVTCYSLIGIAVINAGLVYWLYVAASIKKEGSTLLPDEPQSVGFIAIVCLSVIAIGLELTRSRLSQRLETLK
jgi:hypothetical protein